MASSSSFSLQFLLISSTLLLLLLLLATSVSDAQPSFRPSALVLPVRKDSSTLQYLTHINQRTPVVSLNLVIDLGGEFLWVDCETGYLSTSYRSPRCGSAQCSLARSPNCVRCLGPAGPNCGNNTCTLDPFNPVMRYFTSGSLTSDIVFLNSTNGSNLGRTVSVPQFLFACLYPYALEGLAKNVQGVAGLGRTPISLPSQFSSAFSFHRKFAICLPSSTRSNGVIFFGDGPYVLLPNIDVSKRLIYTPLLKNPLSYRETEYFIGVKSIKINKNIVSVNKTLLSINSEGNGGTTISTADPYTIMETSIYHAFTEAYIKEAKSMNITRVASVAPFGVCFDSKNIGSTRVGPAVPTIDLVLQNESVFWRIFGANSMVKVRDDVLCLGFVEGGSNRRGFVDEGSSPRTPIVIGGYQLEDNLLQFDLATSRLGFSSTLLSRQTTCSNFNFT